MKKKKKDRSRKPIQAQVDYIVWDQLKIRSTIEGRTTGQVLEDAIQLYLESKKGDLFTRTVGFPFA